MARVTIEDCIRNVSNSYELSVLAAKRARQLLEGGRPLVNTNKTGKEKVAVIALREIAENKINTTTDLKSLKVDSIVEITDDRVNVLSDSDVLTIE